MAISVKFYSKFPKHLLNSLLVDMNSETAIKCMLLKDTYTPNQDVHDFVDDIRGDECPATGNYATGGVTLTTTILSTAGRITTFDADDCEWADSTITARYAVLYDDTEAADGDKPLILYVDFGEDKISEDGLFKIAWNASGIFTMTVPA